jgi:hypothetical protein
MARGVFKMAGACCAAALLTGCPAPPSPVALDLAGAGPNTDLSDLRAVLRRGLDADGRLVMYSLKKVSGRLDAQLRRLAVTGPTASPALFAARADRLAYWYNARAAWAIKLALLANCPTCLSAECLEARPFPLDGRTMTLSAIDERLRADADWRTLVAAPSVRMHRARLPAAPFDANGIRRRIAERFEEYVDDEDRFVIDVGRRKVRVAPVLWQFRDRLIAEHHRRYGTTGATLVTALLPYVHGSARRRLQDALGYRIGPMRLERRREMACVEAD